MRYQNFYITLHYIQCSPEQRNFSLRHADAPTSQHFPSHATIIQLYSYPCEQRFHKFQPSANPTTFAEIRRLKHRRRNEDGVTSHAKQPSNQPVSYQTELLHDWACRLHDSANRRVTNDRSKQHRDSSSEHGTCSTLSTAQPISPADRRQLWLQHHTAGRSLPSWAQRTVGPWPRRQSIQSSTDHRRRIIVRASDISGARLRRPCSGPTYVLSFIDVFLELNTRQQRSGKLPWLCLMGLCDRQVKTAQDKKLNHCAKMAWSCS